MSGRPKKHLVDGREMTAQEIADMLGMSYASLTMRRHKMGGCSYQLIVDTYRRNEYGRGHDHAPRHLVEGRWISVREAAAELGMNKLTLLRWCKAHRAPLSDAVAHYREWVRCGRRHGGHPPRRYRVKGEMLTAREASEKYQIPVSSLYDGMRRHHMSMDAVIRRRELRKARGELGRLLKVKGFGEMRK